jgi:hypothetical protein
VGEFTVTLIGGSEVTLKKKDGEELVLTTIKKEEKKVEEKEGSGVKKEAVK